MTPGELWWWIEAADESAQREPTIGKKHKISQLEAKHMYERAFGPVSEG
jgi:hypothetical protein